jgi:alkylated DNA repair protein (DNA oxidative demethylase)
MLTPMARTRSPASVDPLTQSLWPRAAVEQIAPDAVLLPELAAGDAADLCKAVEAIASQAPWRQMVTPGGFVMSVAMTNCGEVGWVSDRSGYRYSPVDPQTGQPWPAMPPAFAALAARAADMAGFGPFEPDACLINRYLPGSRLTAHQDRNERDLSAPVVSVSLGVPAVFFFGGLKRRDPAPRHTVSHGDVVVWGRQSRLAFHGVARLAGGEHPLTGACRINLTFRRAR